MALTDYDQSKVAELRGFLRGFSKLQEALSIESHEYTVQLLPLEGEPEEVLQQHFDSLGQKLKPPVKRWNLAVTPLEPWQPAAQEVVTRWLISDPELKAFYDGRRLLDRRPGEAHLGNHDVARVFVNELEAFVGKKVGGAWHVAAHALVGSKDRYLATLDDHIAIALDGALLLVSFTMNR
jgi:hypothetical protein